jgi:hypothetical protein
VTFRTAAVRALQAVFVLVFIALLYSNWNLRRRYAELSGSHAEKRRVAPFPFRAGDASPKLHVVDTSGHSSILDPAAWPRESFLVFALPGCSTCRAELNHAAQVGNRNFTVVSLISGQAGARILDDIPAGVPAYFLDPADITRMRDHIDRVPDVLRISPGGKIVAVCESMTNCGPPITAACPTCAL